MLEQSKGVAMALEIFVDEKNKTFYWEGTPSVEDMQGEYGFWMANGYTAIHGKAPDSVKKKVNDQKLKKVEAEKAEVKRLNDIKAFNERRDEIEKNLTESEREYLESLRDKKGKINSQVRRSYLLMIDDKNKLANEDDKKKFDDAYRAEKEEQARLKAIKEKYKGSVIDNARKAVEYDKMEKVN